MPQSDQSIPESLMIAVDKRHHKDVQEWWARLTDKRRADFLEIAALSPEQISTPLPSNDDESNQDETNEWYEYIVNQDVRFYFDRSDPQGNYNIVHPIMTPISNAADIEVVSHLLGHRKDG